MYKKLQQVIKIIAIFVFVSILKTNAQSIVFIYRGGTHSINNLNSIKHIEFSKDYLSLQWRDSLTQITLADLKKIVFKDLSTGIQPIYIQNKFVKLYPNPVIEYINLQLSNPTEEIVTVTILSANGNTLYNQKHYGQHIVIPVSTLDKGIYFCKCTSKTFSNIQRFIKK